MRLLPAVGHSYVCTAQTSGPATCSPHWRPCRLVFKPLLLLQQWTVLPCFTSKLIWQLLCLVLQLLCGLHTSCGIHQTYVHPSKMATPTTSRRQVLKCLQLWPPLLLLLPLLLQRLQLSLLLLLPIMLLLQLPLQVLLLVLLLLLLQGRLLLFLLLLLLRRCVAQNRCLRSLCGWG